MKCEKVCTYANTNHVVRLVFKLLIMNETSGERFFCNLFFAFLNWLVKYRKFCQQDLGAEIREKGHEYGVTTGRPRRIGWLDGPMLVYSSMINGYTA